MNQVFRSLVFASIALSTFQRSAYTQSDGEAISLGVYRRVSSQILDEDRILQVFLPTGYESTGATYPVIYLFYSDWVEGYYSQLVNDLYHLSIDRIPPFILVGVENTYRYRDLLPWPRSADHADEEGYADRFLSALREEIIPFVDAEYRTKPYRVMVGPQAAAVFGIYALLEAPEMFQAFIVNDPCRFDSQEHSLCGELAGFASTPGSRGKYIAVSHGASDDRWDMGMLESLRSSLQQTAIEGFRWRIEIEEDWPFFLAPVNARDALIDLFKDYPFQHIEDMVGWSDIRSHYEELSEDLGFAVDPPSLMLTQAGSQLAARGKHEEALKVLHQLVALHPHSLDGPWQLANLHRVMGDTATAIRYYEECLRREPNMVPARSWLDRLKRR
jgi:enterochelin esterase-like enzyme